MQQSEIMFYKKVADYATFFLTIAKFCCIILLWHEMRLLRVLICPHTYRWHYSTGIENKKWKEVRT